MVDGFELKQKPITLLENTIYPMLKKFDPSEKYDLCADIKNSMYLIIQEANYYCYDRYEHRKHLDFIDQELAAVKIQMATSLERKQITQRKHDEVCEYIKEIGRIVGGLKKSKPLDDEFDFEKNFEELVREHFAIALMHFPKSERQGVVRAIMRAIYDVAKMHKAYLTDQKIGYMNKTNAALCALLDYVNISKRQHYITRKKAFLIQMEILELGKICKKEVEMRGS